MAQAHQVLHPQRVLAHLLRISNWNSPPSGCLPRLSLTVHEVVQSSTLGPGEVRLFLGLGSLEDEAGEEAGEEAGGVGWDAGGPTQRPALALVTAPAPALPNRFLLVKVN